MAEASAACPRSKLSPAPTICTVVTEPLPSSSDTSRPAWRYQPFCCARWKAPCTPQGVQSSRTRKGSRACGQAGALSATAARPNKALRQFRAITANMIFPVMCRRRTPPAPLPAQPPRPNHRLMRAHSTLKNMAVGLKLAWTGASPAAAAAAAGR